MPYLLVTSALLATAVVQDATAVSNASIASRSSQNQYLLLDGYTPKHQRRIVDTQLTNNTALQSLFMKARSAALVSCDPEFDAIISSFAGAACEIICQR